MILLLWAHNAQFTHCQDAAKVETIHLRCMVQTINIRAIFPGEAST